MKMDRWNEICYLINEHKNKNTKEELYQLEIQHIFEKVLGWSRYNGEIIIKEKIKVGSTNSVIPDLIIRKEENNIIAIEIKRALSPVEKHREQLFSYMRLLKVQFGLLIGDKIQLFFDIDTKSPKMILEIEFKKDNTEGLEFIKLISKEIFDEDKIIKFCYEKLNFIEIKKEKKEILNFLKSEEGEGHIIKLIADDLYKKYNEEFIDEIISQIAINIFDIDDYKNSTVNTTKINGNIKEESKSNKLPIEFQPNDKNEFKKLILGKKTAKLIYYYSNGKVEEKDWNLRNFTESSNLIGNLRSRIEARKGNWMKLGIQKLIVKIIN